MENERQAAPNRQRCHRTNRKMGSCVKFVCVCLVKPSVLTVNDSISHCTLISIIWNFRFFFSIFSPPLTGLFYGRMSFYKKKYIDDKIKHRLDSKRIKPFILLKSTDVSGIIWCYYCHRLLADKLVGQLMLFYVAQLHDIYPAGPIHNGSVGRCENVVVKLQMSALHLISFEPSHERTDQEPLAIVFMWL